MLCVYTCRQGEREKKGETWREREGRRKRERERAPMAVQCFQSQHNALCVCVGVYGVLHASPDYIMMCMHVFHMCVP